MVLGCLYCWRGCHLGVQPVARFQVIATVSWSRDCLAKGIFPGRTVSTTLGAQLWNTVFKDKKKKKNSNCSPPLPAKTLLVIYLGSRKVRKESTRLFLTLQRHAHPFSYLHQRYVCCFKVLSFEYQTQPPFPGKQNKVQGGLVAGPLLPSGRAVRYRRLWGDLEERSSERGTSLWLGAPALLPRCRPRPPPEPARIAAQCWSTRSPGKRKEKSCSSESPALPLHRGGRSQGHDRTDECGFWVLYYGMHGVLHF